MKITLDADYYDSEEFKNFLQCLKERKEVLKMIDEFESGDMEELELQKRGWDCNVYLYLGGKNFEQNKDYVKRTLDLMLETLDKDIKDLIERLGIEHYE